MFVLCIRVLFGTSGGLGLLLSVLLAYLFVFLAFLNVMDGGVLPICVCVFLFFSFFLH